MYIIHGFSCYCKREKLHRGFFSGLSDQGKQSVGVVRAHFRLQQGANLTSMSSTVERGSSRIEVLYHLYRLNVIGMHNIVHHTTQLPFFFDF